MKSFLVDEDLPRSLARALSIAGMEAIHVIDAGLRGRSDADVLAGASRSRRALVTADLDFSNLLEYPLGSHAGIVVVRFPNETAVDSLNTAVVDALQTLTDEELPGSLVIVEPGRVRLRR
jgi:predicted nuclease of predicted toxin-antitoxin system